MDVEVESYEDLYDEENLFLTKKDVEDMILSAVKVMYEDVKCSSSDMEFVVRTVQMVRKEFQNVLQQDREQFAQMLMDVRQECADAIKVAQELLKGMPIVNNEFTLPAPVIHNEIPVPKVDVHSEIKVPPPRLTTKSIKYDDFGRPVHIEEKEFGD